MNYLTGEQVIFIHMRIIKITGGVHGVCDMGLSALGRSQASAGADDLYPDIFSKAAVLLDSMIRNHPFVDGNKRTGIVSAVLFLRRNDYILKASNAELEALDLEVAQSRREILQLADWFRNNSIHRT